MRKANFFIIGAPRCGTTALSDYLRARSDVFFSSPKELNYFNKDFSEAYRRKWGNILASDEEYTNKFFEGANSSHFAVGEGSPWYLISKEAPLRIRSYNPDARIIVMLRSPLSMAPSLHAQLLLNVLDEDVKDFELAWRLQEERRKGKRLPAQCLEPQLVQYRDACMLGTHMKRLYEVFPKEQVLPVQFDRFTSDTVAVYNEVVSFLGLAADDRNEFPRVNARRAHRSIRLHKFVNGDYFPANLIQKAKRAAGINSLGVGALIARFNIQHQKPTSLSVELRKELLHTFSADIDLLEKLLEWDLDPWRKAG